MYRKIITQWLNFIHDNYEPFDIVPRLVLRLLKAIEHRDHDMILNLLDLLQSQGVMLDRYYNLCFASDFINDMLDLM